MTRAMSALLMGKLLGLVCSCSDDVALNRIMRPRFRHVERFLELVFLVGVAWMSDAVLVYSDFLIKLFALPSAVFDEDEQPFSFHKMIGLLLFLSILFIYLSLSGKKVQ